MSEYEQGAIITFYPRFVDHNREEAIISGTPTITINHMWGGLLTVDIDHKDMALMSGTAYEYSWNIPAAADRTSYNVKYNAIYSGVNFQTTDVVGGEDFQVITRKFYDKKGGGFVQRASKADIWTEKEKDAVLEALSDLSKSNRVNLGSIESRLTNFSTLLSAVSADLNESVKKDDFVAIKESLVDVKGFISNLKEEMVNQEKEITSSKELVELLSKKEDYNDSEVVKKLSGLSKSIINLEVDLKNDRTGLVISELDDLCKNLEEFKKVFVLTLPTDLKLKVKERLDNEDVRITK